MTTKVIKTEQDRMGLIRLIESRQLPCTVKILKGVHRTPKQNRLQQLWHAEAAEQLEDESAEEKRAYCKLHFGVEILKDDEEFAAKYDEVIRPLPYHIKLQMMAAPFDFPVTRLMTTKQKAKYLDKIYIHYTGLGVKLTEPNSEY